MGKQPRGPALNCYEETISTVENPPQTATRLFESQLEQERQGNLEEPSPRGKKTADSGISFAGGVMAAQPPGRLRFGRSSRIKQGRDFTRLRSEGKRLTFGCLIANWRPLGPGSRSRLGVITSSRIGGAVDRNHARRLLRESFRHHQHRLAQPVDLVLVARPSIVGKNYFEVERDFLTSLGKAGLLKGLAGT